ncbi:MAG: ComEC/Rec2 family competence protein, partial [Actinomycetota bacterium]
MIVRAAPVAAIGLWAGTILAIHASVLPPALWLLAGVVALVVATWVTERRGGLADAALGLATLLVGLGWGGIHLERVRDAPIARPGNATIVGSLRTDPLAKPYGWSAVLGVDRIERDGSVTTAGGSLWLGGSGSPPEAVRGDRVEIEGAVRVPDDAGFADSLLRRGIAAGVKVREVRILGPSANPFIRAAQGFRSLVGRSIERLFAPRPAALLLGLALGDEGGLDDATRRDFRATGLGHLLVVSGQNVAMVLAPLLVLGMRLRLPRSAQLALGLLAVAFFVVVTGGESSVLRAGVMACLGLVGGFLGRPRDGIALLAGAVIVLLVLDPALAHAVGFQLSAGATAGMVLLAAPLADRFGFLPRPLALALGATLSAQLAVTPVLLAVFREIPLVTVLANVLAAPAVAPALLLGLAAAGLGIVAPPLGMPLARLASVPSTYITWIADRLARAPVAWITSEGGPVVFVLGMLAVLAIGVAVGGGGGGGGRRAPPPPPPRGA